MAGIVPGKGAVDQCLKGVHFLLHRIIEGIHFPVFGKLMWGNRKVFHKNTVEKFLESFRLKELLDGSTIRMIDCIFNSYQSLLGGGISGKNMGDGFTVNGHILQVSGKLSAFLRIEYGKQLILFSAVRGNIV